MDDRGYIDFFALLGVEPDAKPGEVRNRYKKVMKELVIRIANEVLTEAKRDQFLLDLARLNAAFFVLRDNELRQHYVNERTRVMALEQEWHDSDALDEKAADRFRRGYDAALRSFLSHYLEEVMLEAGRDKEVVESSGWDAKHERHAARVLRQYRQRLYNEILERLPHFDVTPPNLDWDERRETVRALLAQGAA